MSQPIMYAQSHYEDSKFEESPLEDSKPVYYTPEPQNQLPNQPQLPGVSPQNVFYCEIDPTHSNIYAQKKCSYCKRLMCLKCSTTGTVLFENNASRECCEPCKAIIDETKSKFQPWLIIFIISYTICWIFFPVSFILGVLGIIKSLSFKKDVYEKHYRSLMYYLGFISLIMGLVGVFTVIVIVFSIIYSII